MRHPKLLAAPIVALAFALLVTPALADDWVAVKLRGVVLHLVDGAWAKMARGDVVPDGDVIRTLTGARVDMQRGAEVVTLGSDTQVQIFDKDGQQFTTVKQYFGTVEVEAEVQNVEHFAVQTRYLAAVVKGTHFVVHADKNGADVTVQRGHVAVTARETHEQVTVSAGQSAQSNAAGQIRVAGAGDLPDVRDAYGKVIAAAAVAAGGDNGVAAVQAAGKENASHGRGRGKGTDVGESDSDEEGSD